VAHARTAPAPFRPAHWRRHEAHASRSQ
jgi:hypothetical protein